VASEYSDTNRTTEAVQGSFREGNGRRPQTDQGRSPFAPMALIVIAILAWTGFQCIELFRERDALDAARSNQESQVQQSQKLRAALDSLAGKMARLAEGGNPNAKLVVDELRKRGVTINRGAASASQQTGN